MNEILRIQTGKVSYNRTSEKRYENLQKVSRIFNGKQNAWRNGHLGRILNLFRECLIQEKKASALSKSSCMISDK